MTARGPRPGARRLRDHRITGRQGGLLIAVVALVVVAVVPGTRTDAVASSSGCPTSGAAPATIAGCQGTDTSLPATSSAVTMSEPAGSQFAGLSVTVNQTKNLVNQAVSVSWSGGAPTFSDPNSGTFKTTYNGNYLQIFECWGDSQSVNPANATDPGPLPTQCEFGGESSAASSYPVQDVGFEYSRALSQSTWSNFSQLSNTPIPGSTLSTWTDPSTNFAIEPFQPADGSSAINQQADYNFNNDPFNPKPFWLNPDFSFQTTNEIDFARTYSGGTGQQLFQVDTGLEAPGLGCGQDIQPVATGTKTPQCWLVVVPRGTPQQENPTGVTGVNSVVTSPLTPQAWQNRIAIPLDFNPVGSNCAVGANAQRVIGGELAAAAFASWEPSLCSLPGKTTYGYVNNNDDQARQNLTNPTYGSVGMSVFSNPIDPSQSSSTNPVVYAPLTLSSVVIGFNIERFPSLQSDGTLQPDELSLSGDRVEHLNLTPRLVAKLLTESYQAQFVSVTRTKPPGYGWVQTNPASLLTDPDFLAYNPEFALLKNQASVDAGTLLVEEGSSDAISALWNWVLADPVAQKWLSGVPDQWGMQVNPIYSTNPLDNPSGAAFGTPTLETFPKSDPYCNQDPSSVVIGPPPGPARALCMLDWSPYASSMLTAARGAATANDGAKTTLDPSQPANAAWTSNGPQKVGSYFVMSVTDSASAARFGLQTASLSRAGDDGATPAFVAPDAAGVLAGEQAMVPSPVSGVLKPNPSTSAAGAYPLPMLTYAASTPQSLDTASRVNYSALIRYTAGAGQVSGAQPGQLPVGYVPLPSDLEAQALKAAATILHPPAVATTATTTPAVATPVTTPAPASLPSSGSTIAPTADSSTGTAAPSESTSPAPSPRSLGPTGLAAVKTKGIPIGALRWALPLLVLIGLAAGLASLVLGRVNRRAPGGESGPAGPGGSAGEPS